MEFDAVIGLEIHVEMKTKSKMFSTAPVTYGEEPNTCVSPVDIAFPGTLPTVNKQAVINAIRVSHALHMEIDHELWFDRKNYFYSDLPKGYQITQDKRPIGKNGYLEIISGNQTKKIGIERLHMEEDTCKQLHSWDCSLLDYNRAGIPLIEIVSKPDLSNGLEAMNYVEKIRSIVTFLDVSDGKMEEGSLRCDVNVSIKEKGSSFLGTKVEIKNLNSIANIQKAIDYEIERQKQVILSNQKVIQETRRFDEASKSTVSMRLKTDSVDYKYFTEANITPIVLSDDFINDAINTSNELAETRLTRYKQLGLSEYDSNLLISDKEISNYFDKVIEFKVNPKLAANWILVDVQSILNKNNITINEFNVDSKNLACLIKYVESGKISNKQAREVFEKMLENNDNPTSLIESLNLVQDSDVSSLTKVVNEVLDNNPQAIIDFKQGKDRAIGFLVGQIMKLTQGKVNPKLTNEIILSEIKKR